MTSFTKAQKWLAAAGSIFLLGTGIANIVGTYKNIPTALAEMKAEMKDLQLKKSADHDLLIQVEQQVRTINHKLDLNGLGKLATNENQNVRYQRDDALYTDRYRN